MTGTVVVVAALLAVLAAAFLFEPSFVAGFAVGAGATAIAIRTVAGKPAQRRRSV